MQTDPSTITETLEALVGGAMTTVIAGISGRLMFHSMEVKNKRRKFLGRELIWEMPVAVGMALIAESLTIKLGLDASMRTGVIAAIAFLGPRVIEELFNKYAGTKE